MIVDGIPAALGWHGSWEQHRGGLWLEVPDLDVRSMATFMRENEVRLITMTVRPEPSGGYRFMYHWDSDGSLMTVVTIVTGGKIASIADILPAADWVEREIRDYYAVEFEGREGMKSLMLLEGDEPGLFSRTAGLGHDIDPADAARMQEGETTKEVDR